MGDIARLCTEVHQTAVEKGFWDRAEVAVSGAGVNVPNPSIVPEKLALIHSEVSEALEALRDGDGPLFAEELADTTIRIFDLCEAEGIDLQAEIEKKAAVNKERPHLHGRKC